MDVSIIIVAWNVRQLLYDCLKSVYDQTKGVSFEVVYVDNASEDGSIEMVEKEFPEVRIIRNEENKGFNKANNQAIEIAQGRYVLLLNSDTVVLDNAIAKTVAFAGAHPEAAVAGCRVLNPDKSLQRTCFMFPSILNMLISCGGLHKLFPKSKFFGRGRMTWWDFDDVREVETVCGCFSLVRREAIREVGLMDERYFMYGDDPDWCYRFKKNGWKVMFTPDAEIIHYGGQTTKQMSEKFLLQLSASNLIFVRLHRNKLAFPLACFLHGMFYFLRVPYYFGMAVLNKNGKKKSFQTVITYIKGGFYSLTSWKKLLMNRDALFERNLAGKRSRSK